MNVYLFVVSSINHPVYRRIQKKRKRLLEHYNIPYTVLINHAEADLESTAEPTLTPIEDEEVFYNGGGYNPFMAQKFLMAVKMLFRSHKCFDDVPNYIIRTNATTYVHFPTLLAVLNAPDFPRTRLLAGWDRGGSVQGMVMVFSKDVLANMLNDRRVYDKQLMSKNDDVSLSIISNPYADKINWEKHMCAFRNKCATTKKGIYLPDKIDKDKWIFRICESREGRIYDDANWDVLMRHFGEHNLATRSQERTTTKTPETPTTSNMSKIFMWALVAVLVAYLIIMLKLTTTPHHHASSKHSNIHQKI